MAARHITIGPQFFANAKKDYADWHWALIREFFQNCIDCGSGTITVDVAEHNDQTLLSVENDGEPMTEEVLVDKLLSLGSSGKNFEGSVGGFGKAKEVLYYCHESYRIHSGNLVVEGSGAAYDLQTNADYLDGTRSEIVIDGSHSEELGRAIQRFITYAQWPGTFHVNGAELRGAMHKGSPRRDLGFGVVYSNRSHSYTMVVRINGTPMFMKSINLDRCVVVELKGRSDEVLTANRDGLREPYGSQLGAFVTELAVDKRSALKNRRNGPRYIQYRGTKMCHRRALDVNEVVQPVPVVRPAERPAVVGVSVGEGVVPQAAAYSEAVEHEGPVSAPSYTNIVASQPRRVATLGTNFLVKNETDLKFPAYYDPGSGEFSEYSRKLVRIWGRIMMQLHRLFDVEAEFSIGFLASEDDEAQFEDDQFGKVYYLSPVKVVEQKYSSSKSFQKRFRLTERDRLIMIGLHEFVHGGCGMGWHDERYAGKLTDLAAKVLEHRKQFNWCFK